MSGPAPSDPRGRVDATALRLDLNRIRSRYASSAGELDLRSVTLPDRAADDALAELTGRLYLKRVLATARDLYLRLSDSDARRCLQTLVDASLRLKVGALIGLARGPELTSWVHRTRLYVDPPERLVAHLGAHLLGPLVDAGALRAGEEILVRASPGGTIDLAPSGMAVFVPGVSEHVRVVRGGDVWSFHAADGVAVDVPDDALQGDALRLPAIALPRVGGPGGPVVCLSSAWYRETFPRDGSLRSSPLCLDLASAELDRFLIGLSEGDALLRLHWPEAWRQYRAWIRAALPLAPTGLRAHNASVHAYRGLITSSARPSYLAAQTLVHETGHNRFSSVAELFDLFEEDGRVWPSVFVGEARPMIALFHGVFSFLQDIHVTARLVDRVEVIGDLDPARYIRTITDRIEEVLKVIKTHARLTEAGDRLVAGFTDSLERSSPSAG